MKEKTMIGKLVWLITPLLLACVHLAEAQQSEKLPRIAVVVSGSPTSHKYIIDSILQGLREYGYFQSKNIAVDYRYAEGKPARFPEIAAELVRLSPDVIVVGGTPAAEAMKAATSTIPIVIGSGGDIVGGGLVTSLAKRGGNLTGSTSIAPDLSGKRLELLKEMVPKVSTIAVLLYGGRGSLDELKQTELAAQGLNIRIQPIEVKDPKDFQTAYTRMTSNNAHAVVIILTFSRIHTVESFCSLRQETAFPRCASRHSGRMTDVWRHTDRTCCTYTDVPRISWTRYLEAPSLLTFPLSSQRSLSS